MGSVLAAVCAATLVVGMLSASWVTPSGAASPSSDLTSTAILTPTAYAYLPYVASEPACPTDSTNEYTSGTAYQYDQDDPVRPAWNHADKNIELRGYSPNTDPGLVRDLVDYGCDDDRAPQFATLFSPQRVPALVGFYRVHHWEWAPSPEPGERQGPITDYPVTALGLGTSRGEILRVPASGYSIGGDMEVIVIYADEDTVALRYTREDSSGAPGYTLHLDNMCTDPNLLALYNDLDDPDGPRYEYPSNSYPLPNLYAGQPLGVARGAETVIAIADTGAFQDPRSLNEFWITRPGYPGF
jgi:hypothetical protein